MSKKKIDLTSEEERIYEYAGGHMVIIRRPVSLVQSEGEHNIMDEFDVGHTLLLKDLRRIIRKPKDGMKVSKDELLTEEV